MVNQCPMLFNSNLFPRESCLKGKLDCHSSLLLSNFRRKFKPSIVSKALPKHITCADRKMTLYPCNTLGFLFTSRWFHRASWHLHGPFKRQSELYSCHFSPPQSVPAVSRSLGLCSLHSSHTCSHHTAFELPLLSALNVLFQITAWLENSYHSELSLNVLSSEMPFLTTYAKRAHKSLSQCPHFILITHTTISIQQKD